MSYCRWSCDDFQSDVYVYESCLGHWLINVAANRVLVDRSKLPPRVSPLEDPAGYITRHRLLSDMLKEAKTVAIPHELAGASLACATPGLCADKLEKLKAEGFHVPDGVIESLREEDKENQT